MEHQQSKGAKFVNIVLFLIMLGFLVYFITTLFNFGGSDLFNSLRIIGLLLSLAGSVIGYFGINRAHKGSMLRGLVLGFVVGLAVITIIVLIMAPK